MFPIKCDDVPVKFPPVTALLILLCAAAFVWTDTLHRFAGGFVPVDFMYALFHPGPAQLKRLVIMLVTAFFLHASIAHLVANMWYLWIFGSALEHELGSAAFTAVYLACGVISMLTQALSAPLSTVPIVGASGAIAGVMGAFLVFLPLARIVVWIPPIFFPRVYALAFLLLWFVLQYLSMRLAPAQSGGVAWWAHIGGFCAGLSAGFWLRGRNLAGGRVKYPAARARAGKTHD